MRKLAALTGVSMLVTPAEPVNTVNVETTLSFAIKPVINEVDILQSPKPRGANIGAITPAIPASMLSFESLTTPRWKLNVFKNQITIVAIKITVNALVKKSFAFSHKRCNVVFALGSR